MEGPSWLPAPPILDGGSVSSDCVSIGNCEPTASERERKGLAYLSLLLTPTRHKGNIAHKFVVAFIPIQRAVAAQDLWLDI